MFGVAISSHCKSWFTSFKRLFLHKQSTQKKPPQDGTECVKLKPDWPKGYTRKVGDLTTDLAPKWWWKVREMGPLMEKGNLGWWNIWPDTVDGSEIQ